ncbi:MAG: 16S rRNA (guanine(527)-N(7))-methyltransferase RsmG [Clostridia bacterium]|nr:16S rRNA (guanine(527)-N(7))-methyltransferase RsmG [Clostridia bacterium]
MQINWKEWKEKIEGEQKEKFELYFSLLKEYNEKFNLTAITDKKEVILKHFVDSAVGIPLFPMGAKCIEVGSGGGFPSLPVKIFRDDLSFTLVESVGKKCEFLRVVVDKLQLQNVDILHERAEVLARDEAYREQYDLSTARAVAKLNTLSEYLLPFLKVGGKMIAYKGDTEEETEAVRAIEVLGGRKGEVISYSIGEIPQKRKLITIDKIKRTPEQYPRGNGKERSKPL